MCKTIKITIDYMAHDNYIKSRNIVSKKESKMTIVIETGYKPPKRAKRGRPVKYPFMDMNVGDSFLVPAGVKLQAIKVYCCTVSKRGKGKFEAHDMGDGSYRVFRVK